MPCFSRILLLIACLPVIYNAHCQADTTKPGPVLVIENGSRYCKLHNINFRYHENKDSGWSVLFYGAQSAYMLPGDTATSGEVTADSLSFYSIEYTYVVHNKTYFKKIDTAFTIQKGELKRVVLATFYIPPPWWQTLWFKTAIAIVIMVFIYLVVKYFSGLKLKKQKRILEKKLAIQNERMRISSEMHDDIGAGLFGIKLQTELLAKKNADAGIQEQFTQLHESVSEISAKMREVIWSLDVDNDTLNNLISFIYQQAHRMFTNSEINLTITAPDNDTTVIINGEVRRQIYLIIKEALNNILKHSHAKNAGIHFKHEGKMFTISIEDDGIGFKPESASVESMGLRSMKERAKAINGELNISQDASGTRLTIRVLLKD